MSLPTRSKDMLPPEAIEAWEIDPTSVRGIAIGLINQTFRARGREELIVQKLHPVFGPEVNLDIEAVTNHLAARGLCTPALVRTVAGDAWIETQQGVYRALTYLPGVTLSHVAEPRIAEIAGGLVGRFHSAVADLQYEFRFQRAHVHDFGRHIAALEKALVDHRAHPLYDEVAPIAETLLEHARACEPLAALPRRVVHGDLKISNVLFSAGLDEANALVDLDTLAHGNLAHELGDAMRSWCNPRREDEHASRFEPAIFAAAMRGYGSATRSWLTGEEASAFVIGTRIIALELATRFAADALVERYFGWDESRYPSRGHHNLARASSQRALADSILEQRADLERIAAAELG